MRIAQVSPLIESVPPRLYGGTERVVSWVTEELTRMGHDVTLFASGDSCTKANLHAVCPRSMRLDPDAPPALPYHVLEVAQAFEQADQFDVIHCHMDFLAFPFARSSHTPTLHTLHGRLDLPHWLAIASHYRDIPLVSISNAQRQPIDHLQPNWVATVYHGLPESDIRPGSGKGGYLAFFARLSPEKRPDWAVEVAKKTGLPLKVAGKVDPVDRAYFAEEIEPLFNDPLVEYVGEIGEEKFEFLGNALALIFPIDWPEPFGLVMIEAMACGTPVITRPRGSVPEIIQHGRTGFIADTVDEMVNAVKRIHRINRRHCVETVQERFSAEAMARRYLAAYEAVMNGNGRTSI
jgi:glycosyltransferase involved in cell wall biosynthesis